MVHIKVSGTGVKQQTVTSTAADTTIYVRIGGDDTANGLTVGTALATPQAAIDRIPYYVNDAVVIDIGAGTFGPMAVTQHTVSPAGSFVIQGAMKTSDDLGTGTATGTADGGTTAYLDDSGQAWTTDNLKGRFLEVGDANPYLIESNTGTRIYVTERSFTNFNGKAYTIQDCDTTLDQGTGWQNPLKIRDISGFGSNFATIIVKQLKLDNTEATALGMDVARVDSLSLATFQIVDTAYFGLDVLNCDSTTLTGIYISGATAGGMRFYGVRQAILNSFIVTDIGTTAAYAGLSFQNCGLVDSVRGLSEENDDGNGYEFIGCAQVAPDRLNATNNAGHGIYVDRNTVIEKGGFATSNTYIGSGNSGWGAYVATGSKLVFSGTSTVLAGTSGDVTINDGATNLDWSSDFSSDGDKAVNSDNFCLIERKD